MMTVECKIDIEWVEDGKIDDIVKDAIIDATIEKLSKSISTKVDEMAVDILNTRVNAMIDKIWEDFIDKRVNVTDKYGDTVETHDSVKDMLKAKLDNFVNQQVDSNGAVIPPGKCGYRSETRLEWLMENIVKKHTDSFMSSLQKEFDVRIKNSLNTAMKTAVSDSLMKNIDVESLIKTVKG